MATHGELAAFLACLEKAGLKPRENRPKFSLPRARVAEIVSEDEVEDEHFGGEEASIQDMTIDIDEEAATIDGGEEESIQDLPIDLDDEVSGTDGGEEESIQNLTIDLTNDEASCAGGGEDEFVRELMLDPDEPSDVDAPNEGALDTDQEAPTRSLSSKKKSPAKQLYIMGFDGIRRKLDGPPPSFVAPRKHCVTRARPYVKPAVGRFLVQCQLCEYSSDRIANLNKHCQWMHTKLAAPVSCCGAAFATRGDLRTHDRDVHRTRHPCPEARCAEWGVGFDTQDQLRRHERKAHLKKRP